MYAESYDIQILPESMTIEGIETIQDIIEELADRLGIHGQCHKHFGSRGHKGKVLQNCGEKDTCCRMAFAVSMRQRIIEAREVENLLERKVIQRRRPDDD